MRLQGGLEIYLYDDHASDLHIVYNWLLYPRVVVNASKVLNDEYSVKDEVREDLEVCMIPVLGPLDISPRKRMSKDSIPCNLRLVLKCCLRC